MKKLLISTAAFAMLLGSASAAPGDNDNNKDRHQKHADQSTSQTTDNNNGSTMDRNSDRRAADSNNNTDRTRNNNNWTDRTNRNQAATAERRQDMRQFRRVVRAERRYHAARYYAPPGYQYRRWSYGQRLPSIYFARNYWLTDFLTFGLFAPPQGYVWVRYGGDALLIDEYTGEIVQVQYGMFY